MSLTRNDATGRRRLPPLLRQAWYGLNRAFRQRAARLGLTPDQFTVLRWLSKGDPRGLTQQKLTDLMASDPNTIAALLKGMETDGLIVRDIHEADRRSRRVRLQPKGKTRLRATAGVARALQREVLGDLPPAVRESFLANLETIATACRRAASRRSSRPAQSARGRR